MASTSTITIGDAVNWTKGSYLVYLAPWGAGSLVRGRDYWDSVTFASDPFPNGLSMSWSWPDKAPTSSGVYNLNAINFGNANHTIVQTPITPLQVSAIGTLTQTQALTLGGETAKYDVITDFWLTAKAGNLDTKLFEVEVFLHTPAYSRSYVQHATPLGTYTDAQGRPWTMAIDKGANLAPDILIMPENGRDVLSGSVDLKGMLAWLAGHGVITGTEYFNGLSMGAEVRQGAGALVIDRFNVEYGAAAAAQVPVQVPVQASAPAHAAAQGVAVVALSPPPSVHDIYRFYDTATGDHFYTGSSAEKAQIQATLPSYRYEGAGFATPDKAAGTLDVHRFYDTATGSHFFTTSPAERDSVIATLPSYHYEGVAFQTAAAGAQGSFALERFYNPGSGQHHYATPQEAALMLQGSAGPGWIDEGQAFLVHAASGLLA